MILLDTNVLSELMRRTPEPQVIIWLNRQSPRSIWTTSVTVFEIHSGLHLMAAGKRRAALLEGFESLRKDMLQERILPFDSEAAAHSARLVAERQATGRPGELRDTMIAGITLAARATLATRNVRHFADIASSIVDPWSA